MKPKGNKSTAAVREKRRFQKAAFWLNTETTKETKTKSFPQNVWEKNDRPLIKKFVCGKTVCGPRERGRQQTNFLLDGQPHAK